MSGGSLRIWKPNTQNSVEECAKAEESMTVEVQNQSVSQDHSIEVCTRRAPSLLHLAVLAYTKPCKLFFGNDVIMSETGIQQGDPLRPVLFALFIDGVARSVTSPINAWYLDDATIGGSILSAKHDDGHIMAALSRIGFDVNSQNVKLSTSAATLAMMLLWT